MPRFRIGDADMASLIAYLKQFVQATLARRWGRHAAVCDHHHARRRPDQAAWHARRVVAEDDFCDVYLSKGVLLEAQLIADRLRQPEPGPDVGGWTLTEVKRFADGLIKVLESERARVPGVLADEVISVMTMARYLIEDAAHRTARGELEEASEELLSASARIRDATQRLVSLCSELKPRALG